MFRLLPTHLTCERLAAPRGLATATPRFSWALQGDAARQSAYQIVVGADGNHVSDGRGSHWAPDPVSSQNQHFIAYGGQTLGSDEVLYWSVRVWDETGAISPWAEPREILTGLRDTDWQARWIARYFVLPAGREIPADTPYDNPFQARPADHMRCDFTVKPGLARATLYISALGLYEASINGRRVGDEVMAPGWTDYHQRAIYQAHDVTGHLTEGANTLGALLGEGWYCGRVGHNQRRAGNHYGGRPALIAQLHLHHTDGSVARIATGPEWTTHQGPVAYSDFLMGEHYDARLEMDGWDAPGFDDTGWQPVEVFDPDPQPPRLVPAKSPPVRETVRFTPKLVGKARSGALIYDVGQNIAGYVALDVTAARGDSFTLRHGEMLDADGELYVANLRFAQATDHFTARGAGPERFKPRFTFHGFRFVALTLPDGIAADTVSLTAIAIHSDLDITGSFTSGNAMVNQLAENILWSQRGNFLSVPTDCPQRDERYGWSADAQVFWRTAGFNMDVSAFFGKWFDDIADAQLPDGAFTDVAPSKPLNPYRITAQPGAPGWGDGPVLMVWQHYLRYGDARLMAEAYPALCRWLDHIDSANPDRIRKNAVYNNYGDWLNVGPPSDRTMVATAYFAHTADTMAQVAHALGRPADTAAFEALAGEIRTAFNAAFVDPDGRITGDTQTAYLLALDFALLPETLRPRARDHLIEALDRADGHLQTGFLGVRHLCPVLADHGAADYAYRLLLNETYPGWGFSVRQGATTIWERWDGWTPENGFQSANMNSFNHYAYGSVGEWLFARVAGIDWDETNPGFAAVRLCPLFDARLGFVRASYRAPTGLFSSEWEMTGRSVRWQIALPPNTSGTIELSAGDRLVSLDGAPLPQTRNQQDPERHTVVAGPHTLIIERTQGATP
ncbi:family 78 glycoside hydrolase catalytic domain [Acuticoccus sp. MNP-M23]|uniref:family 78 glycoside hydrolase catalytic domain n=1 Tax=Acuticoccus sp. MNP-M23 TaxID=3072793 RepID=UPI0028165D18|nr:family 78 glycoside hydrolase catalytic domain [Acuticoccus sp. MNP-M23]WMS41436.1 family 78 glycoside hydrolase catalytic domain [Acuticoccus sp. MNP-M23]